MKLEPIQPRLLRHRSHYKIYVLTFFIFFFLIFSFWAIKFSNEEFSFVISEYRWELLGTGLFVSFFCGIYFLWLRPKLNKSIQVFHQYLVIQSNQRTETLAFSEIESVNIVCWSIFYVKLKNGVKYYFNSSFERIDYIWEGIHEARPDLFTPKSFEDFRIKLVQYDHHQKRKEWFFKHRMIDMLNWAILPLAFILIAFMVQSKHIVIHQESIYFFRLLMYAFLVLLATSFLYSIVLKKFVFDKRVTTLLMHDVKIRDLEFEGVVLQKSKFLQFITTCFVLALVIRTDINLFSVSKIREDIADFNLKKGSTILIDNRYNCLSCRYQIQDGDFIVFNRGVIGQVLAKEGEMVGQVSQDAKGRMIASENIQEVPKGHIAVKAAKGQAIVFVKIEELIGKIKN